MKLGTVVWSKESGLGIYMYPHEKPVGINTKCSVLSRGDNKIYHVSHKNIKSYYNICWSCYSSVDSLEAVTCPICHWVICPSCGACRKHGCLNDKIVILDELDLYGWKVSTGYDNKDFFDENVNRDYFYIVYDELLKTEEYYKVFLDNNIYPTFIVHNTGFASLFIENEYSDVVDNLIYGNSEDGEEIYKINSDASNCIFCGVITPSDEIVCPSCTGKIDEIYNSLE